MAIKELIKELEVLRMEDGEEDACPGCGGKPNQDGSCPDCDSEEKSEELDDLGLGSAEE